MRSCATCRWSCTPKEARRGDARDQNRLLTREQGRGLACTAGEPSSPWFATPKTAVCPRHEYRSERLWGWALWAFAPWIVALRLWRLSRISLDSLSAAVDNGSAARCAAWSAWRGLALARAASDVLKMHVPASAAVGSPEASAHRGLRTVINAALMEARAAAWHPGLADMVPSNTPSDTSVPVFGTILVVRPEEE